MRYIKSSEEEYWSVYLANACTFSIITNGLHYLVTFVPTMHCINYTRLFALLFCESGLLVTEALSVSCSCCYCNFTS